MKTLLLVVALTCGSAGFTPLRAAPDRHADDRNEDRQKGHGHSKHEDDQGEDAWERAPIARCFRPADREVIIHYYRRSPRDLPPGLAKKLMRTGTLPPGWEKRLRPFPVVVERQLPPVCAYCCRGVIDNYAVVYDRRTRIILDVFALVNDIQNR